jgi:hypothetical protein
VHAKFTSSSVAFDIFDVFSKSSMLTREAQGTFDGSALLWLAVRLSK